MAPRTPSGPLGAALCFIWVGSTSTNSRVAPWLKRRTRSAWPASGELPVRPEPQLPGLSRDGGAPGSWVGLRLGWEEP